MAGSDLVVTICGDQQRAGVGQATPEEAKQVQRCLVGPMDIFKDHQDDLRPARKLAHQRAEDCVTLSAAPQLAFELATNDRGDVSQWPEWPGRRERIARALQDPYVARSQATELLD